MRKFSVKIRITVWLTALTALLSVLLLSFLLSISNAVIYQSAASQLSYVLRQNLTHVNFEKGKLELEEAFRFYQNGVSTLVYNDSKALLAGQIPVSYNIEEAFENGRIRTVSSGDDTYLILDFRLPSGWEDGIWLRGLMEFSGSKSTAQNLLYSAMIALPAFVILAAAGGYRILQTAFSPLEQITKTAESINEAKDLSRRIALTPGGDEFSRLAAVFDALLERLERSFEAEKQFTSDASHELRTPVSIIKSACEYSLKYDETRKEQEETIHMISRQAEKMSEIISQLLNITRLEQETEHLLLEPVDMGELLKSLCEEQPYDPSRLTLNIKDSVTAPANPLLLSRLVQNLIDNAFKYGRPDGHVQISLIRSGNETIIAVQDDGPGIPPEEQEKIWQRFYQSDSSRSGQNGAGLGLPMVKQIARLHGGYMTLESTAESGSIFAFHLPKKN